MVRELIAAIVIGAGTGAGVASALVGAPAILSGGRRASLFVSAGSVRSSSAVWLKADEGLSAMINTTPLGGDPNTDLFGIDSVVAPNGKLFFSTLSGVTSRSRLLLVTDGVGGVPRARFFERARGRDPVLSLPPGVVRAPIERAR